jgi:glyoxylase-like metal-dependent hydrolase (beta-lactamase superfamily II)
MPLDWIAIMQIFSDAPARFALHAAEWNLVEQMAPTLKASMEIDLEMFKPDFFLEEGELIVGDICIEAFHTPGHSPGGISLYWPAATALFTGDLIFKGGLGRTDLPGGNGRQLKESIRRMGSLDSHWLLSGHGEVVSGTERVKTNFKQVEQMWFGYV